MSHTADDNDTNRAAVVASINARTAHIVALRKSRVQLARACEELCAVHEIQQFTNGRERADVRLNQAITDVRARLAVYKSFSENT